MRLRLVYRSRVIRVITPRWVSAITLYPYILFRRPKDEVSDALMRHELEHVQQIRRMGVLRFYATYLWYQLRHGYRDNPLEVAARAAAEREITA